MSKDIAVPNGGTSAPVEKVAGGEESKVPVENDSVIVNGSPANVSCDYLANGDSGEKIDEDTEKDRLLTETPDVIVSSENGGVHHSVA